MSEPLPTKRLHISGLTPSITPHDLERRLSSFGKVKAMDGFGARDALGDPRKFGFVTMEIGAKELVKCLNVLSGSTWKGAKLRIGEAKPDFRERLAQINSQPPRPIRSKRMRAHNYGHPSSTLPLTPLSATAAASTPGWVVTPSGRVVRPMRMRPERPLEPMHSEHVASKGKGLNGKVKKRVKPPSVRARRRLIDPTKWDSVYLKGVFLDAMPVPLPAMNDARELPGRVMNNIVYEEVAEEREGDSTDSDAFPSVFRDELRTSPPAPQLVQEPSRAIPSSQQPQEAALATFLRIDATKSIDVRDETNAALTMLYEMFGDKEDWDGRESVDEMEGLEGDEAMGKEMQVDEEDDDVEIVPREFGEGERSNITQNKGKGKEKSFGGFARSGHEDEVDGEETRDGDVEMEEIGPPVSPQIAEPAPPTSLKALFAPREDVSFSLLDHLDLDLDLELDADILGINRPVSAPQEDGHPSQPVIPTPNVVQIPATIPMTDRVTLDPSLPLLFPPLDSLPHSYSASPSSMTTHPHHAPTCFLFPSATRVRGLYHLPPSITFTRSPQDTSESIRERWERDKPALTREWKKAWREARGSRKGRSWAGGEVGGGY